MYRIVNQKNLKLILSLILVIMLFSSPLVTSGEWQDDFRDGSLSNWELRSVGNEISLDEYNWEVENGALVSKGNYEGIIGEDKNNFACHQSDVEFGHWFIDVKVHLRGSIWRFILGQPLEEELGYSWIPGTIHLTKKADERLVFSHLYESNSSGLFGEFMKVIDLSDLRVLYDLDINDFEWHTYLITRNNLSHYELFIDGVQVVSYNLSPDYPTIHEEVCIMAVIGDQTSFDRVGGVNLGNYPPEFPPEEQNNFSIFMVIGAIFLTTTILLGSGLYSKKFKKKLGLRENNGTIQIISNEGENFELTNSSLYYLLSGQREPGKKSEEEIRKKIPQELINYRYLLHPIRLTMMKLLNNENEVPSAKVRNILKISWGDFATHTKSLQDKGYIEIKDSFDESGSRVQVLLILEKGKLEFEEIFSLLTNFVENNSPYESILYDDSQFYPDHMYPKS